MFVLRIFTVFFVYLLIAAVAIGLGLLWLIETFGKDLPSRDRVINHQPATITRLHATDGTLISEYASKRRLFVPIEAIPARVQNAFIAAEDKQFRTHKGVDWLSILESVPNNVARFINGRRLVGSSTITMQVAKNFVVGDRRALDRKVREVFSAMEIEKESSKDDILELYLNEIYFGVRSYGIAAAALSIFNKSVEELELHEAAYLAAVIKGPENYHPERGADRALERRNWVLDQMADNGFVSKNEAELAKIQPIGAKLGAYRNIIVNEAPYFAEEVRKQLVKEYSISEVNEGGLSVRTTVDLRLQNMADKALRDGLLAYDKRHGYRGPLMQIDATNPNWTGVLQEIDKPAGTDEWELGVVLQVNRSSVLVGLEDGTGGYILLEQNKWAKQALEDQKVGPAISNMNQVLAIGDVVLVSAGEGQTQGRPNLNLQQVPQVNGGLIALSPHTGRVVALSGGWSFADSEFNRATQAKRQPGSTIKPFVFLAALDRGMSPNTSILDSPVVIEQVNGETWRPGNYDGKFLGQQPMRVGLEKSRNLMTVRLAQEVGMDTVTSYAKRFGIGDGFKPYLSSSLGSNEATLLDMTTAYAMLANGGRKITPTLIDRVQDRKGVTRFRHDARPCSGCDDKAWQNQPMPVLLDDRVQMADPVSIYQIQSMLRGVVIRGTARGSVGAKVDRPVAGKTGTTNNFQDAWFVGFTPDLVVGVYIGFDQPKSLGKGESGGRAAAPIFTNFVNAALEGTAPQDFRRPRGIVVANVDPATGMITEDGSLEEVFREDQTNEQSFEDGSGYLSSGTSAGATIF